jgi:hypothetical protein
MVALHCHLQQGLLLSDVDISSSEAFSSLCMLKKDVYSSSFINFFDMFCKRLVVFAHVGATFLSNVMW